MYKCSSALLLPSHVSDVVMPTEDELVLLSPPSDIRGSPWISAAALSTAHEQIEGQALAATAKKKAASPRESGIPLPATRKRLLYDLSLDDDDEEDVEQEQKKRKATTSNNSNNNSNNNNNNIGSNKADKDESYPALLLPSHVSDVVMPTEDELVLLSPPSDIRGSFDIRRSPWISAAALSTAHEQIEGQALAATAKKKAASPRESGIPLPAARKRLLDELSSDDDDEKEDVEQEQKERKAATSNNSNYNKGSNKAKKNPPSKAEMATPSKSKSRGCQFTKDETDNLLSLLQSNLPIGGLEWDKVVELHAQEIVGRQRDAASLQNRFNKLYKERAQTGDPACPPEVRQAKYVQPEIVKRSEADKMDDDDEGEVLILRELTTNPEITADEDGGDSSIGSGASALVGRKSPGGSAKKKVTEQESFLEVMRAQILQKESELKERRLEREEQRKEKDANRQEMMEQQQLMNQQNQQNQQTMMLMIGAMTTVMKSLTNHNVTDDPK